MCKPSRAVLRDADGGHLSTLNTEEAELYELLAENGDVQRFTKTKKGRLLVIFKLKRRALVANPSDSQNSETCLTNADSEALIEIGSDTPRTLLERWAGWGLISVKA